MSPLSGWKQIAVYLNQGIRTVQRWEKRGLPVHRVSPTKRSPVVAFPDELDAWERNSPMRLTEKIDQLNDELTSLKAELESLKRQLNPLKSRNTGSKAQTAMAAD